MSGWPTFSATFASFSSARALVCLLIQSMRLDIGAHRALDRMHHGEHALLGRLVELALDISLAERVAELVVGRVDAALPARRDLRLAVEQLAEEREVFVDKSLRRHRDEPVNQGPAQIGLPVLERQGLHERLEPLEETWIRYIQ